MSKATPIGIFDDEIVSSASGSQRQLHLQYARRFFLA